MTTAPDGAATIADIGGGTVLLTFSAPGYRSVDQVVTPAAGPATTVEVRLQPLPGSLEGTITDVASGVVIAGAEIVLGSWHTSTDKTGHYHFGDLPPGVYTLRVTVGSYLPYEVSVTIGPGAIVTAPVALQPLPPTITVTVVDAVTGEPIAGATISYNAPGGMSNGPSSMGDDNEQPCADVALLVPLKRSAEFARVRKRVADPHHLDSWQEDGLHFFVFLLHVLGGAVPVPGRDTPVAVFAMDAKTRAVASAVVVTSGPDGQEAEISDLRGVTDA